MRLRKASARSRGHSANEREQKNVIWTEIPERAVLCTAMGLSKFDRSTSAHEFYRTIKSQTIAVPAAHVRHQLACFVWSGPSGLTYSVVFSSIKWAIVDWGDTTIQDGVEFCSVLAAAGGAAYGSGSAIVQYKVQNSAAVKLVTKASQWRELETRGRRTKGRGALHLRIASFAGNSKRQNFVRCIVSSPLSGTAVECTAYGAFWKWPVLLKGQKKGVELGCRGERASPTLDPHA
ncbi:hypothetical protein EVAR_6448_1 [Eumeta japonica]|uniref:Uncharacterized protein n=1 Tax=Eumeta variegata TaxID=151549 RepID=A0A4C1SSK4_EUMVA|nr:hypothetical protein EVAR_6448_1 [Eumeta japonica]